MMFCPVATAFLAQLLRLVSVQLLLSVVEVVPTREFIMLLRQERDQLLVGLAVEVHHTLALGLLVRLAWVVPVSKVAMHSQAIHLAIIRRAVAAAAQVEQALQLAKAQQVKVESA